MNKVKAFIFASCLIGVNAFSQQTMVETIKPIKGQVNSISESPRGTITTQKQVTKIPVPTVSITPKDPTVPLNQPVVSEPVKNNTDIQYLSSQSNEQYMKRRNNAFASELTKCIDDIPKNTRGQRNSELVLKCASITKNYNNQSVPIKIDEKIEAIPEENTAQKLPVITLVK